MNRILRKILFNLLHLLVFCFLTILSQVGGLIYLLLIVFTYFFNIKRWQKFLLFLALYTLSSFIVVPKIAPLFGRVSLPLTGNIKPLNYGTYLLNRQYVTPELRQLLTDKSKAINKQFPGTKINYLDANFPFFNGFPLLPHLSHSDGKKVDIAFLYEEKSGRKVNSAPSLIGYGVYDFPLNHEDNIPKKCKESGQWQYSLIHILAPKWNAGKYQVDITRTSHFIKTLCADQLTSKIFIEPHLKSRWKLSQYKKIRFHGCHAVRHDDHIHLEIN